MSNFLLKSPDAVLIHIPKTAGSSIRYGAWDERYEGPVFGHIPDGWAGLFKFAFVRHPLDRLVSAWLMFRDGTLHPPKSAKQSLRARIGLDDRNRDIPAKFPDLPLGDFLDIVMDESIDYDFAPYLDNKLPPPVRVRHHTLPQTHPYNCLDQADFVGRHETLADDFAEVAKRLGGGLTLPHLRQTARKGHWSDDFDARTLERAVEFYRDDFHELGYELPVPARA